MHQIVGQIPTNSQLQKHGRNCLCKYPMVFISLNPREKCWVSTLWQTGLSNRQSNMRERLFEVTSICPERSHSNLPAKGRALKCQGIVGSPSNVWRQLDTFEGSESAFACVCMENIEKANLQPLKTVMNLDAAACQWQKLPPNFCLLHLRSPWLQTLDH